MQSITPQHQTIIVSHSSLSSCNLSQHQTIILSHCSLSLRSCSPSNNYSITLFSVHLNLWRRDTVVWMVIRALPCHALQFAPKCRKASCKHKNLSLIALGECVCCAACSRLLKGRSQCLSLCHDTSQPDSGSLDRQQVCSCLSGPWLIVMVIVIPVSDHDSDGDSHSSLWPW